MMTATAEGDTMTDHTMALLQDIPDLSGVVDTSTGDTTPWLDGWYAGTIQAKREYTDQNGNDRVFETTDDVSAKGDSRNIKLQVEIKRQEDGKTFNISHLLNYRPEDLTKEMVQQVLAHKEKVQAGDEEWGPLFRSFMTLNRLGKLQTVAGVRGFARNGNGGLDLTPLFGKTGYFRIRPDARNDKYKEIADLSATAPKKAKVL